MPKEANIDVDLPLVAHEFFAYILHLTEIQEPSSFESGMTERELREKVSNDVTEYGQFNEDYVFTEDPTEEFVSIGEMNDDDPTVDEFVEVQIDNSWNVINNGILKNVLQYDQNATKQVKNIAQVYSVSIGTKTTRETIKKVTIDIKAKKYYSFSEANSENIDTSMFNRNYAVPMEQRYKIDSNNIDRNVWKYLREIGGGRTQNIAYPSRGI
jgi:hypothetical protein